MYVDTYYTYVYLWKIYACPLYGAHPNESSKACNATRFMQLHWLQWSAFVKLCSFLCFLRKF